ncbi:MAG: hypothetical protein ACW99U_09065 [Candidatus Thorarchaeota archaeon]|jgi:hypothetical protein
MSDESDWVFTEERDKVSMRFLKMWGVWSKTTGEVLHIARAKHLAASWAQANNLTHFVDIHEITEADVSGLMGGRSR